MKTHEEVLADITNDWRRHIHSWEDWYRYVDKQTKFGLQSGLPPLIVASQLLMYSFLMAMREMPDEGDITILTSRTAHIMVMESSRRLGLDIRHLLIGGDEMTDAADHVPGAEPDPTTDKASEAMVNSLFNRLRGQ